MSIHLSMHLSIYPSAYVFIHLSIHLSMYLSIYPSIYPCLYPSSHLSICVPIHLSKHILNIYVQNLSQICGNTKKNDTKISLGGHWLNMDPFGVTFGTLRLHLGPIWNALAAFLVSLGVILETLGRLNATQSAPECHLDSQGEFSKDLWRHLLEFCYSCTFFNGFLKSFFWIMRELYVY